MEKNELAMIKAENDRLVTDVDKLKAYMAKYHSASLPPAAAAAPDRAGKIRAAHLLVKHAGSRRPASWREQCKSAPAPAPAPANCLDRKLGA